VSLGIELDHDLHGLVENASLLPRLEAFMQGAAAHTEPIMLDGFPLTARPQHIPNAVDHRPMVGWWSPSPSLFGWFGQNLLDFAPQRARHAKESTFFGFGIVLLLKSHLVAV
jgi:hypothetical protein